MKLLEFIKKAITKNVFVNIDNYHIESEYKKIINNPDGSIEYELLVRVVTKK